MSNEAIFRDLGHHFRQRVDRAAEDYLERLGYSGAKFTRDEVCTAIMTTLLRRAAWTAHAMTSTTLDQFLEAARDAYQTSHHPGEN